MDDTWREMVLEDGDHLFRRGDPGDALYQVVDGELEAYYPQQHGERLVLDHIGPGEYVGEMALLDDGVRSASVVAMRETRLRRLERAHFLSVLSERPGFLLDVISLQNARLRRSVLYLEVMAEWASMVSEGDYQGAQEAIRAQGARECDPKVARFVCTFADMVSAVQQRDLALRRQIDALKIEYDRHEESRKVSEITESQFFRHLLANAEIMRERLQRG